MDGVLKLFFLNYIDFNLAAQDTTFAWGADLTKELATKQAFEILGFGDFFM
jgi:hypothetical protein